MKIVAFKTRKPKPYNYKPLFYDKKKEEMEKRLRQYTDPAEAGSERLRMRIRDNWRVRDASNRSLSGKTFLIYILIALALLYFIFFY